MKVLHMYMYTRYNRPSGVFKYDNLITHIVNNKDLTQKPGLLSNGNSNILLVKVYY